MHYCDESHASSSGHTSVHSLEVEMDRKLDNVCRETPILPSPHEMYNDVKHEEDFIGFATFVMGVGAMAQHELIESGVQIIKDKPLSLCHMFKFPTDFDWKKFHNMRFSGGVYMKIYSCVFRRDLTARDIMNVLVRGPCYPEELDRISTAFKRFGVIDPDKNKYTYCIRMRKIGNWHSKQQRDFWDLFPDDMIFKSIRRQIHSYEKERLTKSEHVYRYIEADDTYNFKQSKDAELEILIFLHRTNITVGVAITRDLDKRLYLEYGHFVGGSVCAEMIRMANIRDNEVLLDLACGTGSFLFEALTQHNCMCIGIEFDPVFLFMCESNVRRFKKRYPNRVERIQILKADLFSGFFNLFTVDAIVCELTRKPLVGTNVEEYKSFVRKLVQLMAIRCRPQCRAIILVPTTHVDYLMELADGESSIKFEYSCDMACVGGVGICCVLRTI